MSASSAYDAREQVRQAVDIVELIGGYIDLRRQGRVYVGICPWHDDSRPSLQVNQERQSWKCWVCNIGGDVFSFVMQREGVGFREALQMLADQAGIQVRAGNPAAYKAAADEKRTLYQAMDWAVGQYHECLLKSSEATPARDYLHQRGIQPESMQRFRLGFSPNSWQWISDRARTTPFSLKVLESVGLVGRSANSGNYYDRFKGRVLFPIRDLQGRSIAIGGRILPEFADERAAKYVNSPETRLFSKSEQLYGLDTVRDVITRTRKIVVVEGYTDAVMAWQSGIDNVAAVLGTALGARHIQLLRRFVNSVTLVLDGDEAGQKRTNEILELFVASQMDLRVASLPEGLDPCDFLVQRGPEALQQLVAGAVDALEHQLKFLTHRLDPLRDTHRANEAVEKLLATLAQAPRLASDSSGQINLRQEQMLSRIARVFGIPESDLRSRLSELRKKSKKTSAFQRDSQPKPRDTEYEPTPAERELLQLLLRHPDLASQLRKLVLENELSTRSAVTIYSKIMELEASGITPEFGRVLTELEDAGLKNLLVDLDERERDKPSTDTQQRVADIAKLFEERRVQRQRRASVAELQQEGLDEKTELELLKRIYES